MYCIYVHSQSNTMDEIWEQVINGNMTNFQAKQQNFSEKVNSGSGVLQSIAQLNIAMANSKLEMFAMVKNIHGTFTFWQLNRVFFLSSSNTLRGFIVHPCGE